MSSDPMTPLESLLRAAEALRACIKVCDPPFTHWTVPTKEQIDAFDAALARYRAEPDLEARVAELERWMQADRMEWTREVHNEPARAVREGQNEQGEAAVEAGASVPRTSTSTQQQCPTAPAPSGEAAAHESRVASPTSSPPAFARETPREWSEEQRSAALLIAGAMAGGRWTSLTNMTDVCAEIEKHAHLFVDAPLTAEEQDRIADAIRCPPSPPPETRTDDVTPGMVTCAAYTNDAAQTPKRETDLPSQSEMSRAMWKAWYPNDPYPVIDEESSWAWTTAATALRLVSEHVARVEATNRSLAVERDAANSERDRLKAECERLRANNSEWKDSHAVAMARADAAERKLSECEEDNSAWRTEAFEQRVRAQKAEKRLATAAPRAPAEGIEKAVERKRVPLAVIFEPVQIEGRWAVRKRIVREGDSYNEVGDFWRGDYAQADERATLMQRAADAAIEEWRALVVWMDSERPSPATPGPIVMPEREALALAIITAYDAEQGEEYDPSTEAHLDDAWLAEADAALSAFRAANDGATFEQEGT